MSVTLKWTFPLPLPAKAAFPRAGPCALRWLANLALGHVFADSQKTGELIIPVKAKNDVVPRAARKDIEVRKEARDIAGCFVSSGIDAFI